MDKGSSNQSESHIAAICDRLHLMPHPEGGYLQEVYRSTHVCAPTPAHERSTCTVAHFLLPHGDFSAFHRLSSDEIWFHCAGSPIRIFMLRPGLPAHSVVVGGGMRDHETHITYTVPAGVWFASEAVEPPYSLTACVVSPGFDYADFEMADRQDLIKQYPHDRQLIERLTRTL